MNKLRTAKVFTSISFNKQETKDTKKELTSS